MLFIMIIKHFPSLFKRIILLASIAYLTFSNMGMKCGKNSKQKTLSSDQEAKETSKSTLPSMQTSSQENKKLKIAKQISGIEAIDNLKKLENNQKLTDLMLNNHHIDDTGAIALAEILETDMILKLKILSLSGNQIKDQGATALAKALETNKALNLDFLVLDGNQIGVEGSKYISESLKVNSSLTSINLSCK